MTWAKSSVANGKINGVTMMERIEVIHGINLMGSKALTAQSSTTSRRNLCWLFKMAQFLEDTKHLVNYIGRFSPWKGQRFILTGMSHTFAYNFAFFAWKLSACSTTMGYRVYEILYRAFNLLTQYSIQYQFRPWVPFSNRSTIVGT